jgi:ATP-dependent Clp protease protease subunit
MGAFLLAAGAKGKRIALPHSEIMIHQPLGGSKGQVSDVLIHTNLLLRTRETLNQLLAQNTGKSIDEIARDTERDNFMTAAQALEYGLIDKIIERHV